ncbi:MAG: hypothetical protein IPK14_07025 [Blastocatellia bacterium]|nr:hypothetical protein [Blastocatellia bacterium]
MYFVLDHANKAALVTHPPVTWPGDNNVLLSKDKYTLILFSHPKCPCTRATLEELARLMTQCQSRLKAYALFSKPKNSSLDWEQTDIWETAKLIPDLEVKIDLEGQTAEKFNASTSGQVVVYDPQGKLLFSGGITSARGHAGDNIGRSSIVALVNTGVLPQIITPVFGCTLCLPNSGKNNPEK